MAKYILVKSKDGTQNNLWEIIGETDTGKSYEIKSRNTYRDIKKKYTSPSENNPDILIGKVKMDIKPSEIDVTRESHDYIQERCWKCGFREGNFCTQKKINLTTLNERLANECWSFRDGFSMKSDI